MEDPTTLDEALSIIKLLRDENQTLKAEVTELKIEFPNDDDKVEEAEEIPPIAAPTIRKQSSEGEDPTLELLSNVRDYLEKESNTRPPSESISNALGETISAKQSQVVKDLDDVRKASLDEAKKLEQQLSEAVTRINVIDETVAESILEKKIAESLDPRISRRIDDYGDDDGGARFNRQRTRAVFIRKPSSSPTSAPGVVEAVREDSLTTLSAAGSRKTSREKSPGKEGVAPPKTPPKEKISSFDYRPYIVATLRKHVQSCMINNSSTFRKDKSTGLSAKDFSYTSNETCSLPKKDHSQANRKEGGEGDEGGRSRAATVYLGVEMFPLKDQAPRVFGEFRNVWGIEDTLYLKKLCASEDCLKPLGSAGKSGAFFYISKCQQFIVKTISKDDSVSLMNILQEYYEHQTKNKNTLLPRFLGLHHIRVNDNKSRFVIMQNVFYSPLKFTTKFDLKGSTQGRGMTEEERGDPNAIRKDLDVVEKFEIGSAMKEILSATIKYDTDFLERHELMDYSFLVAHYEGDGTDPTVTHPDSTQGEFFRNAFQQACGGMLQLRETGRVGSEPKVVGGVYNIGIIDILQVYNRRKLAETTMKSSMYAKDAISCVDSKTYASRFSAFMNKVFA